MVFCVFSFQTAESGWTLKPEPHSVETLHHGETSSRYAVYDLPLHLQSNNVLNLDAKYKNRIEYVLVEKPVLTAHRYQTGTSPHHHRAPLGKCPFSGFGVSTSLCLCVVGWVDTFSDFHHLFVSTRGSSALTDLISRAVHRFRFHAPAFALPPLTVFVFGCFLPFLVGSI